MICSSKFSPDLYLEDGEEKLFGYSGYMNFIPLIPDSKVAVIWDKEGFFAFIKRDDRFINLMYFDKARNTKSISLPFAMRDALMTIAPEKEFSFVQVNSIKKEELKQTSEIDEQINAIKKIKELLDMGILTQEEFDAKKKQILGI